MSRKAVADVRLIVSGKTEADMIASLLQALINGHPDAEGAGVSLTLQAPTAGYKGAYLVRGTLSTGIDAPDDAVDDSQQSSERRIYPRRNRRSR